MNNRDGIMKRVLKSKKALSTVVTTLIILVVSVLLATVVTFYAINVTSTRVQEENLQIYKQHIWLNGSNFAEAAFLIANTGGRDVVIDKISVRGQECLWTTIYFNKTGNLTLGLNMEIKYCPGLIFWQSSASKIFLNNITISALLKIFSIVVARPSLFSKASITFSL